jgi:hypothetical protein
MRIKGDVTKYRVVLFCVIVAGSLVSALAGVPAEQISGFLQDLTTRIEEAASAPVLKTDDAYVLEEYLNVMVIQNPAIRQMARINPDGTIFKLAGGSDNSSMFGDVTNKPWFVSVCRTKRPHNSLIRDQDGTVLVVRVWPLLGPADEKRLIGLVVVKVDVKKYIQSLSDKNSEPIEILFGTTPIFSRNWTATVADDFLEDSFTFSATDKFVVRYLVPENSAPEPAAAAPKQNSEPSAQNVPATASAIHAAPPASAEREAVSDERERKINPDESSTDEEAGENKTPAVAAIERDNIRDTPAMSARPSATAETSNAATVRSWLSTDSILTTGYTGSSNRQVVLFLILAAGLGFVMIFIVTTIMVRRARRQRREEREREIMFRPEPVPFAGAENDTRSLDQEDTRILAKEDTRLLEKIPAVRPALTEKPLDSASHAERETREFPALREFIDDFLKKIHEVSKENNVKERNRLFEEIHDDLNVWARSEIRQLSGRLGLLLQSIKECESKEGNSAELQVLRYEIMRIVKEIEGVEDRLPQRNPVLIVS